MADDDYFRITKFKNSSYEAIKKAIFHVTRKLGSGSVDPVPYDTAWVARVPKTTDLSSPAFPDSLHWLRDHQRDDGTWGAEDSSFIHSKILNTFASVLAFAEWNRADDERLKRKGIEALAVLGDTLPRIATNGLQFEMILSGLMNDARKLRVDIPYEYFEWHFELGKKKLEDVKGEFISNVPSKYWTLLEATTGTLEIELDCYIPEVTQYGLIAAQPSTTAFLLRCARLKGSNIPQAEWALETLCVRNKGGVPHLSRCDSFEIIQGLDFLLKANINPAVNIKHSVLNCPLSELKRKVDENAGISFSCDWSIPDNGCSQTAQSVLRQWGQANGNLQNMRKNVSPLEDTLSTNSKLSPHLAPVSDYQNMDQFVESSLNSNCRMNDDIENKTILYSKWNVSIHYNLLENVFTHQNLDTKSMNKIASVIGNSQNDDGGWGTQGTSTAEETAYVCLTLTYLIQNSATVLDYINLPKLTVFMDDMTHFRKNECFWCNKVNFHQSVVSEAAFIAAKYALFQIERLYIMTNAFNENRLDFINFEIFEKNLHPLYQGLFLLTRPTLRKNEIELMKEEVMEKFHNIFQVECLDNHTRKLIDASLEISYLTHDVPMPFHDRVLNTVLCMIIFLVDDVFDSFIKDGYNLDQEPTELLSVCSKIFRGYYKNFEEVPALDYPRFSLLSRGCFYYYGAMKEKRWNAESSAKLIEKSYFKGCALYYKLQRLGIELTPKTYLQISKIDTGLIELVHHNSLVENNAADSTEFENYELFLRYREQACKAARLLSDVPSALKDEDQSNVDNYCVQLRKKYGISLREAMIKTNKKGNKAVIKMCCFKKMILEDPEFMHNEKLSLCMENVERFVNGFVVWSVRTPRYQLGRTFFAKRVYHTRGHSKFIWDLCFE